MRVQIVDHQPGWTDSFRAESHRLTPVLQPWLVGPIEHVGSTAVPGLAAKPIVDMAAPVQNLADATKAIPLLERVGYRHWADDPHRSWRIWLLKPAPERRTHHLYLMEPSEPEWDALRTFRDHLRTKPGQAAAYARLKRELARRYPDDRDAYTQGKTDFISRVFARLRRPLPHPREATGLNDG